MSLQGPAGEKGIDGRPGRDGKDGQDGWTPDDLAVAFRPDARALEFTMARDGRESVSRSVTLAGMTMHRGVYEAGKSYDHGDVVTWNGSAWHAASTMAHKPGSGTGGWTLIVKHGAEGKPGPEGKPGRDGEDLTHRDMTGRKW